MTVCIYDRTTQQFGTKTYSTADFLNKILWHGYCYQMGACGSSITCAEPQAEAK